LPMHFVRAATSSFFPAYSLDKIPRDPRGRMHDLTCIRKVY
jgi:hypothetical protein